MKKLIATIAKDRTINATIARDRTINATINRAGEVNTGENLGDGLPVFAGKEGVRFRFNTVKGTGAVTIEEVDGELVFNVPEIAEAEWGNITGELSDQTDLQAVLTGLQNAIDGKASQGDLDTLANAFGDHVADTDIHFLKTDVSKDDVGLGNVPNLDTTDAVNKAHTQGTDTKLDEGGTHEISAEELRGHVDDADIHFEKGDVSKEDVGLPDVPNLDTTDAVNKAHDQNTDTGTSGNDFAIGDGTAGEKSLSFFGDFLARIKSTVTAARDWVLPDKSGTIALLDDIPTPTPGFQTAAFAPPGGFEVNPDPGNETTHVIISPGAVRSEDREHDLLLTSSLTKRIDQTFDEGTGNGMLDTGSVEADETYHIFAIRKDADGAIDILASKSLTPALPSGWGHPRRIWAVLTKSSSELIQWFYSDRWCVWRAYPLDFTGNATSTAQEIAITVPRGINVQTNIRLSGGSTGDFGILLTSLLEDDRAPVFSFTDNVAADRYTTTASAVTKSVVAVDGKIRLRATGTTSSSIHTFAWRFA